MTAIIDWGAKRARMMIAFILLAVSAGALAYVNLPKEGEPDIEIPALFISVPFPGISTTDSESMLVKVMETEMADLDGLKKMSGTAAEGYGGLVLEFEFGWDKSKTLADVRDRMTKAEAKFPAGADKYSINEINFSEFPIVIIALSGDIPERTMLQVARQLEDRIKAIDAVLDAQLTGHRDEMLEVVIDPLKLEAYNVTAGELISVVVNNNQLIAAGEVESENGTFSVKIPSSFTSPRDVFALPVKVNGDSIVRLGDLADIRLTFKDRAGTARFNGETTVALQIVKRKGFNHIDTVKAVRAAVAETQANWDPSLREALHVSVALDQSRIVAGMVAQLEGSVMTAIALVMIVVLAALGTRSALLVGFAVPASFLLTFVLFGLMGVTISNIVMFGLILAVGMLVDSAIVVVEYADKRIQEGQGPMRAYIEGAKRMFWPIASSTATTLCAFAPMLFWPGVPGQFMGMLPTTLIFVLTASFIVAVYFLPIVGGVSGRMSRSIGQAADLLRPLPWLVRAALVPPALYMLFLGAMQTLNPGYLFGGASPLPGAVAMLPGAVLFILGALAGSITLNAARLPRRARPVQAGYRRTAIGHLIKLMVGNPVMPLVSIAAVIVFMVSVFSYYGANNKGTEFFVQTEPEQAIVFVRARGNLSLAEKDAIMREAEEIVLNEPGLSSAFTFAGDGGLNRNTGGGQAPRDTVGQIQIELTDWSFRTDDPDMRGSEILRRIEEKVGALPGIKVEVLNMSMGPASAKPINLRLFGDRFEDISDAVDRSIAQMEAMGGITSIEDTRPLPGIDWQISVDVEKAGRFGADVATVGGMVQLVTRGILLDTMRVDTSDEEIDIRVRVPEGDRVLATLDSMKVRTRDGLVPLSNFITREPVPKLGQINRVGQKRYYDIKADSLPGMISFKSPDGTVIANGFVDPQPGTTAFDLAGKTYAVAPNDLGSLQAASDLSPIPITATERIEVLTQWLETPGNLPTDVGFEWVGDFADQQESGAFLSKAFSAALGMMFIILLAQFNSFYNSMLVLLAVVLSTTGVLIGMLVMDQTFSIIMTGTGIVALAGIVVNNNIILIDTYQEYARLMPRIEAIIRTVESRIRPVLLTTITTMAGLAPMMLGISLDFIAGGYTVDSPTALWWKQLATAVVFGLGVATILTLLFTPSLLALRVWIEAGAYRTVKGLRALSLGKGSSDARALALQKAASKLRDPQLIWEDVPDPALRPEPDQTMAPALPLRAAE